jgi:hypothetical protein
VLDRDALIGDAARRAAEKMTAKAEGLRAALCQERPAALALRSGAEFEQTSPTGAQGEARLRLPFMFAEYAVTCPAFQVYRAGSQEPASPFVQAIVLSYLQQADGTPRAHQWVSFRELPGGQFYHRAFQGYTGDLLARTLGNDLEAFKQGAEPLAEVRLGAYGDAAYAFCALPRVYLAAIYWLGDEEFAPRASLLFDRAASHYLPLDGLAVIGSQLTHTILAGAKPRT